MLRAPISLAGSTRRGMVTAQVALSLSALMAMLALVADGGLLLVERRHAQATADAAALAAASDLYAKWYTNKGSDSGNSAYNSAIGVASANGYTNDGTTSTVTVNIPPKAAGFFNNKAGYAEVIVTWNQQRSFSGIFGSGAIPVSARAVARGVAQGSSPAVLLLSPTASPALSASGNGSLTVTGGSVVVNSSAADAISASGNASLTAQQFSITGNDTKSGNATITTNPTQNNIQTGVSATADPLSYIAQPTTTGMTTQSSSTLSVSGNSTKTLSPGVYIGGISISANATVTLQPGVYYMQGGGFSVSGNGNVTGNGVMIYNDASGGSVSISGNGSVTLSPMTTGLYAGITLFQALTATATVAISGNGTSTNISGTIYAANAQLSLSGNGGDLGNQYIASTLTISGNGSLTVGYDQSNVAPARDFGLVQ